ncbi:calcium-dependent phosphotriesterase [Paraphaeosphaeria sporulosa]|uniref:Calcium-dependent phosphotriesterase n=1 Tax=Paraphaeosphaeria sporulosa TaxID=1460663 RepID=A0A177CVW2_9PLEO|nr:calcium-dependent phosphotriesterase [Paraphaeosphaeria sporulosa]OAG11663.1 calcium-dependent phosphotriesterase [Paraphaeosphaeria sporulosa]
MAEAQNSKFQVYLQDFGNILGASPKLTLALSDDSPLFHEACVFVPRLNAVFVTSNQFVPPGQDNKTIVISKLSRGSNGLWRREELDAPTIPFANGGINYDNGILFCAQGSLTHNGGLLWMSAEPPYSTKVVVDNYRGYPFNSPNDVVVHSDGSIWFTDPAYGVEQGIRPEPKLANQVYVYTPADGDVRVMADGFGKPNGICFSPDEQTVYITDSDFVRGDGNMDARRARTIYAFDLIRRHDAPFLTNRRVFAYSDTGIPDGIKCDTDGNVYSGCGDGLNVWNPGGSLLGKVRVPGGVANFCFGRSGELFLLNETKFWVLEFDRDVRGALLKGMGIDADGASA